MLMSGLGNIFRRNLRTLRKSMGISQEELADMCDVSYLTIGRWERGESWPKPESLSAIAVAFNVEPQDLLADTEKVKVKPLNTTSLFKNLSEHPGLVELIAKLPAKHHIWEELQDDIKLVLHEIEEENQELSKKA